MIQRKKIVSQAEGIVLEIGFGSGLNLPFFNKKVKKLLALEPSLHMQKIAHKKIKQSNIEVDFLTSFAESIPINSNSVDCVVCTYTLCSIVNVSLVLSEIKRVLKKNGKFLVIEHIKSRDNNIQIFQNKINPFWKILAGGCHLNCDTKKDLEKAGFDISDIEEMYIQKVPKFIGYNIMGSIRNK